MNNESIQRLRTVCKLSVMSGYTASTQSQAGLGTRQFRLSVRHMRGLYQKAERIIEILSLSDRTIILVFRQQCLLRKYDGFIPNEGAE